MFYGAKVSNVSVGNDIINYAQFGKGRIPFVIIVGLGDGITQICSQLQAMLFSRIDKEFAEKFNVYVFGRKNTLQKGYTTREMAKDQATALKSLGISKAYVMGVSQGGMIAQYLAIDYPDMVKKLVLTVTLARPSETIKRVITSWMEMARRGDYEALMVDNYEKIYSERYLEKHRRFYPITTKLGKPASFERFLIQAESCINHNAYDELHKISCPTLIIGGSNDKVVGTRPSFDMKKQIPNAKMYIYQGLGHGTFEEAKDFNKRIVHFLTKM